MNNIPPQLRKESINFVLIKSKEKTPFETGWQKKTISFIDPRLIYHINKGGNYGVRGGGEKNLIILDFDSKELQDKICENLPKTFTVKSGSGLYHKYFFSNKCESYKIFSKEMDTLADVQGEGKQVVGPNSIHPNGNKYEIVDESEISFIDYDKLKNLLMPFDEKPKKKTKEHNFSENKIPRKSNDDLLDEVKSAITMESLLNHFGINTSKNPTECPFHSSKGGKCLGFDREVAHCFHCDDSWNIFSLTKDMKNCDFKEALEYLCDFAGLNDKLEENRKEFLKEIQKEKEGKIKSDSRPRIIIPGNGKLISEFAIEVGEILKDKNSIFLRSELNDVVEIKTIYNENGEKEYTGFSQIRPNRFITLLEKYISPVRWVYERDPLTRQSDWVKKEKSISGDLAKTLIESEQLQDKLPVINRIFTIPIPIMYQGELTFPKKGYDGRFHSWRPFNSPEISNENMSLEEAKKTIEFVFKEFCFQEKQDFTNAVAGLLTPFLRGLFSSFTVRTPLFIYLANRERAGKDYCAGINGLVYEGFASEEPPISTGERTNSNDELRKKILSALMQGRKRLHFSNNKGYINNSVFESILTNTKYSDRILGKNELATLDNELDFSLSGNVGMGYTPDLANRSKFIRFFLDIENANERKFNNPNLHKWILKNRDIVLSALFSLVKNWIDNGSKSGSVPFTSFPEWAEICGGIMESAGFENPCKPDKDLLSISGDNETTEIKNLFELCYAKFPEQYMTKNEIIQVIHDSEEEIFNEIDLFSRSGKMSFGRKMKKYIGRIFSDIRMVVNDINAQGQRQKFKFTKNKTQKIDRWM